MANRDTDIFWGDEQCKHMRIIGHDDYRVWREGKDVLLWNWARAQVLGTFGHLFLCLLLGVSGRGQKEGKKNWRVVQGIWGHDESPRKFTQVEADLILLRCALLCFTDVACFSCFFFFSFPQMAGKTLCQQKDSNSLCCGGLEGNPLYLWGLPAQFFF